MASSSNSADPTADEAKGNARFMGIPHERIQEFFIFLRIFTYATALDKCVLTISSLAAMAAGLTMPLMTLLFGKLVGSFTDFFKDGEAASKEVFIAAVNQCVLSILYVFLARLGLQYIANLGFNLTSMRISATIRMTYLQNLFALPISTLDMLPPGQTAAIITITASNLQSGISEKLPSLFASISSIITAFIIAFADNWLLTCVTSFGIFFIATIYFVATPKLNTRMAAIHETDVQAASVATESFTSSRMVAACGAETKMTARYATWVEKSRQSGREMARIAAVQQGLVYFGVYATFALAFWAAFQMYMTAYITSSESVVVVLLSVMIMASSVSQISAPLAAAAQAASACAIFHTIIDAPKTVYGVERMDAGLTDGDIVFKNVNFIYPTRPEVKVLDDLNLHLPAGKMTAIVGPSGSGKSTIAAILQRWYEFNGDAVTNPLVLWLRNGEVSISGRSLTQFDVKWWRNQVGMVQQENTLFDTSIFENVAAGLVGTEWEYAGNDIKYDLVKRACQDAYADEFIARLPKGYHTSVGEFGMKLSGGQRQRIAIARAIIKQPKILILDEATSAIDVRSEQIVQAALDRACQGRTTVVIAHRLGTVKKADSIVVLQKGHVVQQGSHPELMADTSGPYWQLAMAQTLGEQSHSHSVNSSNGGPQVLEEMISQKVLGTSFENEKPHSFAQYGDDDRDLDELDITSSRSSLDDTEALLEKNVQVITGSSRWSSDIGVLFREQGRSWFLYLLILTTAAGVGASTPIQAFLFANLVSLFSLWGPTLSSMVNFWCLAFFCLAVGVGISYAILAWSTTTLGFRIMRCYRKELFSNIMHKSASFFDDENNSVGTLTARLATDPAQLHQLLGTNLAFLLVSVLNLVGCVIIGVAFGWKLTLVALGTTMPIVIAAMVYRVRLESRAESKSNEVFAESAKFASESISAIRVVSSLTMEDRICRRYSDLLSSHIRAATKGSAFSILLFSFCDSISLLCMAFVLWYGGQLIGNHEYSPFQYMVVYIAVVQGGLSAGQWLSFGPNIAIASAAANRVITSRDEDDYSATNMTSTGLDLGAVPVLKGLSLEIKPGQFAAFVGPSGSGKTTLVSLLERFYAPEQGEITCNGTSIGLLDLEFYRKNISLVGQEPSLFSGSIRDNILLGMEDETFIDEAELHQAARDAGMHDFITSLPEGYDTEIGPRGVALSGGQKQRISIARALLRQPSLLLLDEATSSLDSQTEREIQTVFEAMKGKRTMIAVAHRLATIQNADVIFVISDGRVMEQGSHSALVASNGIYSQMSQALDS